MSSFMSLMGGMFFKDSMWMFLLMVMMILSLNLNLITLEWGSITSTGILMDNLCLMSATLTVWVCLLIFIVNKVWMDKVYKYLMSSISLMLVGCFFMSSIFSFYIFFELVLIPMFMLVVLYGNYSERLESGIYMLFYTMLGSVPLLMGLLGGFGEFSWSFSYSNVSKSELDIGKLSSISLLSAFLMKLPMYGFHIWLPKAHVEAPSVGSSILAGVLLKLGGYGIMRTLCFLDLDIKMKSFLMIMGLVGGINCGLACLRQNDMKKLVAYSSVVHMGMVLSGMFTYLEEGWMGSLMMLICHGLCSSGLFFFVNMVYERVMSRSMLLIKGCNSLCSSMMMWCFLLIIVNMGCPPFLSFFSEMSLCSGLLKWSFWLVIFLGLMLFISVGYNIYFYSTSSHGENNSVVLGSIVIKEYLLLFLHFFPVVWFIFSSDMFIYL